MQGKGKLVLAVAGSGKTESIAAMCREGGGAETLVITYTQANQDVLSERIGLKTNVGGTVHVCGWWSLLLRHFARPYVPFVFEGRRARALDFYAEPSRRIRNDDARRYFSAHDAVKRVHLSQLAAMIEEYSDGASSKRLCKIFKRLFIDEVQDLCGYDLEVLECLIGSGLEITMVGDIRQATIETNEREARYRKYKKLGLLNWYRELETKGIIEIEENQVTFRCVQAIADFSDRLFTNRARFASTISKNEVKTDHDGIFLLHPDDLLAYHSEFKPVVLRHNVRAPIPAGLDALNIGLSKGMSWERVVVWPTRPMEAYVTGKGQLEDSGAIELYVAATRARQSVCFVTEAGTRGKLVNCPV